MKAATHIFEVILELDNGEIKDLKGPVGLKNYSHIKVDTYEDFDKHNDNGTVYTAC